MKEKNARADKKHMKEGGKKRNREGARECKWKKKNEVEEKERNKKNSERIKERKRMGERREERKREKRARRKKKIGSFVRLWRSQCLLFVECLTRES